MKNCIVMYTDENYAFAAANMCIGIQRYCSEWVDDIIIFNDSLNFETKNNLAKLYKSVVFKDYTKDMFRGKIKNINVDAYFINRWTHGVFSKLESFDLLKDYTNVIWLDVDMLIQKNFKSILEYGPLAWRTVNPYKLEDKLSKKLYSGELTTTAPNGGLFLFHESLLKYDISSSYAYSVLGEVLADAPNSFDELVIALMALRKQINVQLLDPIYNCWPSHSSAHKSYIIHAGGKEKFWNNKLIGTAYGEWHVNNKIWHQTIGEAPKECKFNYREIKNLIDANDSIAKIVEVNTRMAAVESKLGYTEKHLEQIERQLHIIEKGVFPLKRFIRHVRNVWKSLLA